MWLKQLFFLKKSVDIPDGETLNKKPEVFVSRQIRTLLIQFQVTRFVPQVLNERRFTTIP
jgi:hypothetical protein